MTDLLWSLAGPILTNLGFSGCVGAAAGMALKVQGNGGSGVRMGACARTAVLAHTLAGILCIVPMLSFRHVPRPAPPDKCM